jgi:signal transduction histidine kinase
MRQTAEVYYTIVLATVFFILLVTIIVITLWRYYSRRRAHEMALIEFEQTLLQTRLEIQERTFTSISQEIHDNVGQLLSLAKMQITTLNWQNETLGRERAEDSAALITQSLQTLRDLAKSLNGGLLSQAGLLPALELEIRTIGKLGVIQPAFRIFGEPVSIDENKSLIIFRIAQEALHNVIKHAEASVVELQVLFSKDSVSLVIKDNGKGIGDLSGNAGSGLRNMKDRSRVIGGTFDIQPVETGGTVVTLTLAS